MQIPSPIQKLPDSLCKEYDAEIWIKRDDLIHPVISGNKYRKLKHNLDFLKEKGFKQIVTFGGAYSNHIAATAFVCAQNHLKGVGIIRGEEPKSPNETLKEAQKNGMELIYVSRSEYRKRNDADYLRMLQNKYPNAFIIPEGGANEMGVKGCAEIVKECQNSIDFDYISVDCGTGATLAGMVRDLTKNQKVIGVQVLKESDFISDEVRKFNPNPPDNFEVWTDYHFGGYARYQTELIDFMRWFYNETAIKLDPIYTGKQFFAVFDQLKKGTFPKGSKIVLVHTGGLQGIKGFEERYKLKIY